MPHSLAIGRLILGIGFPAQIDSRLSAHVSVNYSQQAVRHLAWQEGIVQYVEHRTVSIAAATYEPSKEFAALPDFTSFAAVAEKIHRGIMSQLAAANLTEQRRVAFYPFGAGEGLLLDRVNPRWRDRYLGTRFRVEALMPGRLREE